MECCFNSSCYHYIIKKCLYFQCYSMYHLGSICCIPFNLQTIVQASKMYLTFFRFPYTCKLGTQFIVSFIYVSFKITNFSFFRKKINKDSRFSKQFGHNNYKKLLVHIKHLTTLFLLKMFIHYWKPLYNKKATKLLSLCWLLYARVIDHGEKSDCIEFEPNASSESTKRARECFVILKVNLNNVITKVTIVFINHCYKLI